MVDRAEVLSTALSRLLIHDHLVDVDQARCKLAAQCAERRVGDARHRRQNNWCDGCERANSHPARLGVESEAEVGQGADVERGRTVTTEPVPPGGSDHRRVVGAHRPAGQEDRDGVFLACFGKSLS